VFKVNWSNIHFLARDLGKIEPYNIPLIVFNFDETGGQGGVGSSSSVSNEKKGMYFTT